MKSRGIFYLINGGETSFWAFFKRGVECWICLGGVGLSGPGSKKVGLRVFVEFASTWRGPRSVQTKLRLWKNLLDRLDSPKWLYNQPVNSLYNLYSESDLELAILWCSRVRAMWLKFLFVRNLKQEAEILITEL